MPWRARRFSHGRADREGSARALAHRGGGGQCFTFDSKSPQRRASLSAARLCLAVSVSSMGVLVGCTFIINTIVGRTLWSRNEHCSNGSIAIIFDWDNRLNTILSDMFPTENVSVSRLAHEISRRFSSDHLIEKPRVGLNRKSWNCYMRADRVILKIEILTLPNMVPRVLICWNARQFKTVFDCKLLRRRISRIFGGMKSQ
jgi:hypothetical protein